MSSQKEVFDTLLAMGYTQAQLTNAWANSPNKSVEGVVDFLDANPDGGPAPSNQAASPGANVNIAKYIKAELVTALQAQGHSQLIAEKAVLMSGNENAEKAIAWIESHKNDADFAEPVIIEEKPQMSPEEAALKAKELQEKVRAKMRADEEKNALEAEKLRIKMGKELTDQRRIIEEQQKKRDMEEFLRQRDQDARDKEAMLQVLEADKRAKFGDKYVPSSTVVQKPLKVELNDTYDKMYKIYRMGELNVLHTCVKTLQSIVSRILSNPADPQFRDINSQNPNFCQRVKDVIGGMQFISYMGFVEREGKLIMDHPDVQKLREIDEFLVIKRDFLATQY